ncbi:bifunctional hydroxymethylpyrimidine kinase/phosphomethylpyrimidine kinase [Cohnella thailandensis]|uniref:Hydroxymethylpyrimidine/phosphomethylpyrimidine kinase n=1 Tax=Cohnella thailandensis TaxID=557557 RepID=A0A841T8N4_9BACL|nr:bifunctional hydroxymethylpyrimidine kinase/phosphomethylpyrimidine kinase [Cohnella thailandensis]MBB6638217.1 bifunctional hydroxymethylpyrimidine kinase/phosphomethylpyrimidine kinase [Cohnella thailandensis]MBP1977778.1 hydroxymethylpyrimidine/phosphomethylpyrimidine kinase [Cohnella thailandensis]
MRTPTALTIAGSDSGGGAGIQADLKTFQELRAFGMSAITAVTAQNTLGVSGIYPLPAEAVRAQIAAIGDDMGADALKTGMLFGADIIEGVAEEIRRLRWTRVVVDPVMIAKGGAALLQEQAVQALKKHLLPLALVVTPNVPEAETLTGTKIGGMVARREAARRLAEHGARYVVLKGGHDDSLEGRSVDLLFDGKDFLEFEGVRVSTRHTHGTGCTFAAALTAELAKGSDVPRAVEVAKAFIQAAIEQSLEIGRGHGPTNHWAYGDRRRAAR